MKHADQSYEEPVPVSTVAFISQSQRCRLHPVLLKIASVCMGLKSALDSLDIPKKSRCERQMVNGRAYKWQKAPQAQMLQHGTDAAWTDGRTGLEA